MVFYAGHSGSQESSRYQVAFFSNQSKSDMSRPKYQWIIRHCVLSILPNGGTICRYIDTYLDFLLKLTLKQEKPRVANNTATVNTRQTEQSQYNAGAAGSLIELKKNVWQRHPPGPLGANKTQWEDSSQFEPSHLKRSFLTLLAATLFYMKHFDATIFPHHWLYHHAEAVQICPISL